MKILLVDDDEEALLIAGFALEGDRRFTCSSALGGLAGLAKARLEKPDAILTDYRMANMDGLQMMKSILAIPNLHATRFLFFTGNRDKRLHETFIAAGAMGVLAKPFDPSTLAEDIFGILVA